MVVIQTLFRNMTSVSNMWRDWSPNVTHDCFPVIIFVNRDGWHMWGRKSSLSGIPKFTPFWEFMIFTHSLYIYISEFVSFRIDSGLFACIILTALSWDGLHTSREQPYIQHAATHAQYDPVWNSYDNTNGIVQSHEQGSMKNRYYKHALVPFKTGSGSFVVLKGSQLGGGGVKPWQFFTYHIISFVVLLYYYMLPWFVVSLSQISCYQSLLRTVRSSVYNDYLYVAWSVGRSTLMVSFTYNLGSFTYNHVCVSVCLYMCF